jgi:WD40 repeat protein
MELRDAQTFDLIKVLPGSFKAFLTQSILFQGGGNIWYQWQRAADSTKPLLTSHAGNLLGVNPTGAKVYYSTSAWSAEDVTWVWDTELNQEIPLIEGGHWFHWSLSPDGSRLASSNGSVYVWNAESGKQLLKFESNDRALDIMSFNADDSLLAGENETTAFLYDLRTQSQPIELPNFKRVYNDQALVFSPNGELLAYTSTSGISLWNVQMGEVQRTFMPTHTEYLSSPKAKAIYSPDGSLLATIFGQEKTELLVWDVMTGRLLATREGQNYAINGPITFTPDGQAITYRNQDSLLELWYFRDGHVQILQTVCLNQLAVSPDRSIVVATNQGSSLVLCDATTGRKLAELTGNQHIWENVVFSADGNLLAAQDSGGIVRLWAVQTQG